MKRTAFKKLVAYVVTFAILLQMIPMFQLGVSAAAATPDNRVVDHSTMTDWQNYFGDTVLNTENAGGVWGDKSVFKSVADFNAALEAGVDDYDIKMTEDGTNFLVSLSAIAANKSIVGYSAIPTDTMFVLDLSNSMSDNSMTSMIRATNDAIRKLYELNRNNRIGVIVYAGTRINSYSDVFGLSESATVLLPIGKYEGAGSGENETFLTYNNDRVSVANGVLDLNAGETNPSKSASGATYIQAGMQLAVNEFKAVQKADTVIQSGPQAGTVRMPVMVLMSDGAPTVATTSINNVGNSNRGDGSTDSNTSTNSYLTQLTCAWARKEMTDHYERSGLFYTLGLNVGNSTTARSVLDPKNAGTPYTTYWSQYQQAAANGSSTVEHSTGSGYWSSSFTVPVVSGIEKNYVDQYFPASNDTALINAFDLIVDQIIIQSKYYPTLVEDGQHHLDGYITFNDELGEYMEVKEIKGLTVGGNYYKGSAIVKTIKDGAFGNIYGGNLNNLNSEGLAFLDAVQKRLGCTQSEAGEVASQALTNGQLYYNSETDFSNYIGWYADANGEFLGFWNGKDHTNKPDDAVYANKSYGFMGTVGSAEEFNESDMLHISVQVRQNISLGHQMVIYKIPAALIPTVNYNIEFDGDDLETGTNFKMSIDGANEPLRLLFEVGLRSDINRINIADKLEGYAYAQNGVYTLYSNSWAEHTHTHDALVDNHDATYFDFEPSYENERYYYTTNSPVYASNGSNNYSIVSADPRNTGETYYARFTIFSTQAAGLTSATMEHRFVPITEETIKLAEQAPDGTWYIPKGTVHRLLADSAGHEYRNVKQGEDISTAEKTHPTKTLNYSNYPQVVFLADGTVHCDACLGNNGMFTVTAAQGIKLSKSMEVAGLGAGESFNFKITLTGEGISDAYPVYDADGNYLYDVDVNASGEMEISIMADQTVHIADLREGITYKIDEIFGTDSQWKVKESTGEEGTIVKNTFSESNFVNEFVTHGNLIIHKDVVLPSSLGANASYTDEFDVTVAFSDTNINSVKVDGADKAVVDGKLQLKITDGQTIIISNIPDGTGFEVTEPGLPAFWKPERSANQTAISDSQDAVVTLTNTYNVGGVDTVNIDHTGIKNLLGRDWITGDEFTFELQYFNGSTWESVNGTQSVTDTMSEKEFSFTQAIKDFMLTRADHVGTYQFRIREQAVDIGGVNYDIHPKRFEIVVDNNFSSGKLEITDVTTATPMPNATAQNPNPAGTTVNKDGDTYYITTVFNNIYSVSGTASIAINITKQLEDNTGLARGLSGFEFELYQLNPSNEKVNVEQVGITDDTGTIVYGKSWGADFANHTLVYYLAEVNTGEDGITYDEEPRRIEVAIVDNLDGTVSAKVNGTESNVYSATFENRYELESAAVKISGTKKMLGRDITEDDVIEFELYLTDANFENEQLVDTKALEDGKFTLTHAADTAGKWYYTVKEKATGIAGVTDDDSVYYVTVNVDKGDGDTLAAEIESIYKDNQPTEEIEFVNTYAAKSTEYVIEGTKKLDGRDIVDGEFSFVLKDSTGKTLQTKQVKGGKFVFDPINIEKAGRYVYTVSEVKGNATGVTYDNTVYTVTLTVTDDGKANLLVSDSISNDSKQDLDGIVFNNVYTAPVENNTAPVEQPPQAPPAKSPKTGDNHFFLWIALLFVSSGGIMTTAILGKKNRKTQK